MSNQTPQQILETVFGYPSFRHFQEKAIQHILAKKDTLLVMPTGGGKSLCYQIPAMIFPGLTIVVSPLISLMQDQVVALDKSKVPAVFLNSSLTTEEYGRNAAKVRQKQVKMLYVAPETVLLPRVRELLAQVEVSCIAIDEAHCITEWGLDFRPDYRKLVELRAAFPKAVFIALTATATPRVRQEIRTNLMFDNDEEFVSSFDRPNLNMQVWDKRVSGFSSNGNDNAVFQISEFLKKKPANTAGIIYCFSRKLVEEVAEQLAQKGYNVRPYHAGLPAPIRKQNQQDFIDGKVAIIVATIAFGLGINKPDVRFVIHHDFPKSVEGYYQEIGRAGRDGQPADCILLYSGSDISKIEFFLRKKTGLARQIEEEQLNAMLRYMNTNSCRKEWILNYFGEKSNRKNCHNCDNCI